jgi:HPr kinase/phosphorylase
LPYSLEQVEIISKKSLPVRDFFNSYQKELQLTLVSSPDTLDNFIPEPNLNRPGLAFAGFTEVYSYQRIQIIGSTEWSYLESVGPEKRFEIFSSLAKYHSPLWLLSHKLPPHQELLEMCERTGSPVMVSSQPTLNLARTLQRVLEEWFAPFCSVHASLVDVYGVGMLYIGQSNIGKSECVLDLVERGHRLVTDDMVRLIRIGDSVIGKSNNIINHHMEIRGIGIIDIRSMFGIHAVRKVKKVEIIVELQQWQPEQSYERTGLDDQHVEIMGISIPKVVIPILPGKNITVISEVIAMNTLMKMNGIDVAAEFNKNLLKIISDKKKKKSNMDHMYSEWLGSDFYE